MAAGGQAAPDVDTVQALMQRTGGIPLVVLESLGTGSGAVACPPVPAAERLQPSLLRRLARLAAVAWPEFPVPLAAQVLQVHTLDLVKPWQALAGAGRRWQALAMAQVLDDAGWVFDLIEQQGDLAEAMGQAGNLAVALNLLGDSVGAIQAGEQALAFWRRLGQPPGNDAACIQLGVASNRVHAGRFADALPLLHWVLAQFRSGRSFKQALLAQEGAALPTTAPA